MSSNGVTSRKSKPRECLEALCIGVILAMFVRTFVLQSFTIPSQSMEKTLVAGDYVVVNRLVFGPTQSALSASLLPVTGIERGDVIVFRYPKDPNRTFVKRVIGLPGETVVLRNRRVYVDDRRLDEPYARFDFPPEDDGSPAAEIPIQHGPVSVPAGQYFVLGDNRDSSSDSRYWGTLPQESVKGKVLFVYFSIDRMATKRYIWSRISWNRMFNQVR